jgi:hypothetical protein
LRRWGVGRRYDLDLDSLRWQRGRRWPGQDHDQDQQDKMGGDGGCEAASQAQPLPQGGARGLECVEYRVTHAAIVAVHVPSAHTMLAAASEVLSVDSHCFDALSRRSSTDGRSGEGLSVVS